MEQKFKNKDEIKDAYYTLYNAKTKIEDKELERLVNILITKKSTAESSKFLSSKMPIQLKAERILDHFNLSSDQYTSLFEMVPTEDLVNPYGGVSYRFLIHPRLTKEIYKELIKRSYSVKGGRENLQQLTKDCIKSLELKLEQPIEAKTDKKITQEEFKKILIILKSEGSGE